MTLRGRLLWAQAPLVAALLVAVGGSLVAAHEFGAAPGAILYENFRSFDAGLTLLRSLEVLDHTQESPQARATARAEFEAALALQQSNITEPGEALATARLSEAWRRQDAPAARQAVDVILRLNRDAMVRKSEAAQVEARQLARALTATSLAALLVALGVAGVALRRVLAPFRVLAQAARRLAAGDFDARVRLGGDEEVAALANAFNDMAAHLAAYRQSSLGELFEAHTRLESVMDSLADAVIVYDTAGQPTSHNAAAAALLGADLVSQLPEDLGAAVARAVAAVQQTGEPHADEALDAAIEVPARPTPRHLLVGATPIRRADGVLGGITVALRDVSRSRKIEGFRGDLVATAAHELRTPLTSLHMAVHLCLEGAAGPVTPQQADLLGAAREDCERLRAVVEELLEMARLEAGTVHLDRITVGVADLLARAAERHEARARHEGTEVVVEPGDLLQTVDVDPERMRHVLDNLIDNALKHGAGPVRLSHSADATDVIVWVDDAGQGVPEDLRDQVFDKFFRVPGTPRGGTGLGLGLVRDLVVAHGGQVRVESAPAGGARFTIRLPITPRNA